MPFIFISSLPGIVSSNHSKGIILFFEEKLGNITAMPPSFPNVQKKAMNKESQRTLLHVKNGTKENYNQQIMSYFVKV